MISTGLNGFDNVITGLRWGDNVVWQIDHVDLYRSFVLPFVRKAQEEKRKLIYVRFAHHPPLLTEEASTRIFKLDPQIGFESFSAEINRLIKTEGLGTFYVFDCLSDLLSAWSNDLMIGNFFKMTCPFLFELDTIAYFSLLRNSHSFKTVARIRDTTQLLIDVYEHNHHTYIHPLKVWKRYSPTMFLPHIKKGERFVPIANSVDAAKFFSNIFKRVSKSPERKLDYWDHLFMKAENLASNKKSSRKKIKDAVDQLSRLIIARDNKILPLAQTHLTLEDFLTIKSRMIGTGYIGGKSVGMLIARNIVQKDPSIDTQNNFEPHDSFYVGSDVFYTYIVENGLWNLYMEQKTKERYFEVATTLRDKLLVGTFPDEIKEQFQQMMDYFGQSPIIVRSSSLLEDSYGNLFAGKYESIFLVNQGSPEERLAKFIDAVRRVFASTMNEDALTYRRQRGLDQMDEQMALLVQRVSGSYREHYFFPDVAGVGISFNTYIWNKKLDPQAGMVRLVLGLGTRAVNRVEGDYPRVVALDAPLLRVMGGMDEIHKFSQHAVDVLNIKVNDLETVPIQDLINSHIDLKLNLLASQDYEATRRLHELGKTEESWVVTFDPLLSKTSFRLTLQKILKTLESAYGYPVDIEFTANFKKEGDFQINLLQCRPIQTKGLGHRAEIPRQIPAEKILFQSEGHFLGGNVAQNIDAIIYIDPKAYFNLATQSEKFDIARAVGELNRQIGDSKKMSVMLMGPGRWGTTTPSLGIPVVFSEINNISVLGEMAVSNSESVPDVSYGTHFFQDLVEMDVFYFALIPQEATSIMNQNFLDSLPPVTKTRPWKYQKYDEVIKYLDTKNMGLKLMSDVVSQKLICFFQ